ncbi:hypothetical protein GCM10022248_60690 [Nonomuraea soli]
MRELPVSNEAIIAALRRRIDQLIYENAVLQAAIDQLNTPLPQPGVQGSRDRDRAGDGEHDEGYGHGGHPAGISLKHP